LRDALRVEGAGRRYGTSGRFHHRYALGKLRHDPIYAELAYGPLLPRKGTLVDLGCGRGILFAALEEAGTSLRLVGIERGATAEVARRVLGSRAEILRADLRGATIPQCDAITVIDVLHYLGFRSQADLIHRAVVALRPGGVLLVREADAGAGWKFVSVRVAERLAAILRGHPLQTLRYRSQGEWGALLRGAGLSVWARPMGEGTPFANILLVGKKPDGVRPPGSPSYRSAPR
jgi:SAM-dependent methyltransferase